MATPWSLRTLSPQLIVLLVCQLAICKAWLSSDFLRSFTKTPNRRKNRSFILDLMMTVGNIPSDANSNSNDNKSTPHKIILGKQPVLPNECTYWVTENLLAGEYPSDRSGRSADTRRRLQQYLDCGITYFIDLTEEGEKPGYQSELQLLSSSRTIEYKRLPIPDFYVPSKQRMTEILDTIDSAIQQNGHKVYVHCRGGIGRTGTVTGCFLKRHCAEMTGDEVLTEVNRLFQHSDRSVESQYSPETSEQWQFVKAWND